MSTTPNREPYTEASLTDIYTLTREVERRATEYGLSVSFQEGLPSAMTDGQRLLFPLFKAPLSEDQLALLKHMSIHEPLHVNRKELFKLADSIKLDFQSTLGQVINAVEDEVMEHEHAEQYAGDGFDLNVGHNICYSSLINSLRKADPNSFDKEAININALSIIAAVARAKWSNDCIPLVEQLFSVSHPHALAKYNKAEGAGLVDKLSKIGNPEYTFNLGKEIYDLVFKEDPPKGEEQKKQQEQPDEDQDGDTEQAEDAPKASEKQNKPDSKEPAPPISWRDIRKSIHDDREKGSPVLGIDYTGHTGHTFTPYPFDRTKEIDLVANGENPNNYTTVSQSGLKNSASLSSQVKRLLLVETRSEFQNERLSGKLSKRNLFRVAVPRVGTGEWNDRVFKRRIDRRRVDTAVTILVDWSYSMYGPKMNVAAHSAFKLYDVFSNALRIPVEVLSFTTSGGTVLNGIVKPFSEKLVPPPIFIKRFNTFVGYSSGNADADSILWAQQRLKRRQEKRRILMVLSDGSPSDSYGGGLDADYGLIKVIKDLKKENKIEVYGIGIHMSNISRYYGDKCRNISDVSGLEPALIDTLHNVIIKGSLT